YRNRFVKTRREEGFRGGRSSNTHVFAHAGRVLSFVEVALPVAIDRCLETVCPVDFGGVDTAFTAHGKVDPATGELLAFGYQFAHTANAFERDGRVVVDGTRTDRFLSDMASDPPTLYRWEIDLTCGVVTEGALGRHPVEFPRVDERRNGRPYRHAYTVEYREFGPAGLPGSALLRRYDVEMGTSVAKDFGVRYAPGEPWFVPRSADDAADQG